MPYHERYADRSAPTSDRSSPSHEYSSRPLSPDLSLHRYSDREIRDTDPREYNRFHPSQSQASSPTYRMAEAQQHAENNDGSLAIGGIALAGLLTVPASYLSVWLAATSLEVASAMASFTVATSTAAAPYLIAGGAAYATVQGGKIAVKKSTPYVIVVAKDARKRASDIKTLVAVMHREQMKRLRTTGTADAATADSDSDVSGNTSQSRWSKLFKMLKMPNFFSSKSSKDTEANFQILPFEQAVRHQREQQQNGTAEAFEYYATHLRNDEDEEDDGDLANPWLKIELEDADLLRWAGDDDDWYDVGVEGPSKDSNRTSDSASA